MLITLTPGHGFATTNEIIIYREGINVPFLRLCGNLNFTSYGTLWLPELVNFGCRNPRGGRVPHYTTSPLMDSGTLPPHVLWHPPPTPYSGYSQRTRGCQSIKRVLLILYIRPKTLNLIHFPTEDRTRHARDPVRTIHDIYQLFELNKKFLQTCSSNTMPFTFQISIQYKYDYTRLSHNQQSN